MAQTKRQKQQKALDKLEEKWFQLERVRTSVMLDFPKRFPLPSVVQLNMEREIGDIRRKLAKNKGIS